MRRSYAAHALSSVLCLFLAGTALAQSSVDIEKFTNGQDADAAPGPAVIVGATVSWTYVVTNTSGRPITNISVTDDQGVTVTCPGTTLDAGLSFTCTASGIAVAGQYANIGTVMATLPDSSVASDSDPSHYFGQSAPAVAIEKRTNGLDADAAPGPSVPAGSTVNWTYEITNIGSEDLIGIAVTDDQGVSVSCPGTTLAAGASMTCTGSGTAQAGQYSNLGTVAATTSPSGENVVASDPSHYYGQTLGLIKRTNGIESNAPPGPVLVPGSTVTWTYEVTNPGPASVTGLAVSDDQGVVVNCPQTTIAAGETVVCTGSGTAQGGQYTNVGTATATLPLGGTVTGTDTSYYFGNPISLQKATNGFDADTAPGPSVAVGSTVSWTYEVSNHGVDAMTGVAVTDDQGVTVTCPSTTLAAGESMTCTASGIAVPGQYANVGTADATSVTYGAVSASDPSHYFGQTESLDFGDAPDPAYQTLFASDGARHLLGSGVYLGACVDAEAEGFASAGADGDDTAPGTPVTGTCAVAGDDEDGVTFTTQLTVGSTASVDVVASAPCTLSAWIDFQGDGDWGDAGEDLFPGGTALAAGTSSLNFAVPASAVPGPTYARFRCTTDGATGFTGQAGDGEVEDYAVTIVPPNPAIAATKADSIVVDVDGDSTADPGDTLLYTITIANSGNGDASAVVFTDSPDPNTSLVAGSVTTSAGTVTTGNTLGDTTVAVSAGTIPPSASVTITFRVMIQSPLPSGATSVANQGSVSGSNFTTVLTDDPDAPGSSDPTVTPVTITPAIAASKTDALVLDADGDGIADPGDRVRYSVVIANNGNGDALATVFNDTPDANTTLVAGSVTTSQGTVTTGNTPGDSSVTVNVGTLPAGASVTIAFDVTINSPFPSGVQQVSNSGTVSGSNFGTTPTDDPAFPGSSDPTVTPITATPIVSAVKTAALSSDANGDGVAQTGDRLLYTVTIANGGNTSALGVQFTDTPGANTTLVAGSVTTTQGSVATGNAPGDTTVTVDAGTVAAGGSLTITFEVSVGTIPPGVTSVSNTGTVSGSNFAPVATDSPDAPGGADPTVFPAGASSDVPTLGGWGLLALLAVLAAVALTRAGT